MIETDDMDRRPGQHRLLALLTGAVLFLLVSLCPFAQQAPGGATTSTASGGENALLRKAAAPAMKKDRAGKRAAEAAKDSGDKDKKKDEPKWDVNNPPGEWKTATIDTNETTWSDVDVSPDGRMLVFDMLGDIYTVPIEGGEAKALTESIAWDFQPRFSPDGAKIAFISDRGGADNLWVMNADGTVPKAVTEEKEHLVHTPSWSPDGEYIVAKKDFTSTRSIPAGEIWLFSLGGGEGLQIVERPNLKKDQKNIAEPALSPDGRWIYYSQDVTEGRIWQYNKDATGQIFVIKRLDRKTGDVDTFVGGPGGAVRPIPSPDGKFLAFVRRTPAFTSALFVKDLASGKEVAVYEKLDRDLQETDGSQGNAPAFAWTPDGASVVFWAGGRFRRVNVRTHASAVIPVHVRAKMRIHQALRFPVNVAPDSFEIKQPRWAQFSPDGTKALFQALGRLYIADLPGSEPRRLTSQSEHFEFYPSFSADGKWIVYTTWEDEKLGTVRVVSASGGEGRVLVGDPGMYLEPRFSSDGKWVAFRKSTGGYILSGLGSMDPGLYLVLAAGGDPKRLTRSGFTPQFSAAATDRVFYSDNADETDLVLKSVDLLGHDERTHLKGSDAGEFSLSPDGRWLAFTEQYNAFVTPFAFTGRTVEIGSKAKSVPVKQVSKRSGDNFHWSADSKRLHWSHGATVYTRELKDAFSFLSGSPEKLPEPVEEGTRLGLRADRDRPEGRIALVGGRIVTMRDADSTQEVIEDGVLVTNGNRIESVGRRGEVAVPEGSRVFDVTGKTIVPGLVDVHAHGPASQEEITPQQNWGQFADLAFGVTTIHDPSNDTTSIFSAAEMQRAGLILAPRIFSTGTILYGANAPRYKASIEKLDEALYHVRRLADVGAISVKSYQQPRRDQRQQIIEAARQLGVMVVPEGGAKFQHNMTEIVDGHTGIEHAIPLVTGYEDVAQLWSQSTTGYTPTFLVAYGGIMGENYWYQHTDVWKNERLLRYTPKFVIEPRAMRRTMAPEEHYNHVQVARFAKSLRDRGVSVQIGAHGQLHGLGAHWELWSMVQGGFTPWEALRGATIDGARYVGLDKDVGSLEPGKLADLVVIDGGPLTDIRRSEFVAYTMLNGRLYEASTMNQIAPEKKDRKQFFFEREGGDTVHPSTWQWLERLRSDLGWDD